MTSPNLGFVEPAQSVLRATARELDALPRPRGLPLLGNLHQLHFRRLHARLEAWAAELGDVYSVRLGWKTALVIGDAELSQDVLQQRPDQFRRFAPIESVSAELDGLGLFSAEGDDWRRMRKLVLPAFSLRQLRALHPDLTRTTRRLATRWQRAASLATPFDPSVDLRCFTVDVTTLVAFGHDLNTLEQPHSELQTHLARIFNALNRRMNTPLPYWRYIQLPHDRLIERSKHAIQAVMHAMIDQARERLEREPERAESPRTLLEAMLVARNADPEHRFSDDEVAANVGTLLLAGEDTTANTLAWVMHYLAHRPDIQRKLQVEADAVLGPRTTADEPEDIPKLRYATAVTHETLRLRAVLPVNFLEAKHDLVLGDLAVPAGTPVFLLARHCTVQAANFSRPQEFDPDRWLGGCPAGHDHAHNTRANFAFGAGPRACPGRALALIECALVISMVARSFVIEPDSAANEVGEHFDFTLQPTGLRVRLRQRALAASSSAEVQPSASSSTRASI